MTKKMDFLDLRIIEGIGVHGPRNVTKVARKLSIPAETLRKRLSRIPSRVFLRLYTNVYHTHLGLKKAVVFAEAVPGYEEALFDSLKANDFWIYVSRCYGMNEGCHGVFTIPESHSSEFEQFVNELEGRGIAKNVKLLWSTCFQSVHSRTNWYEEKSGKWIFQWDKWIREISTEDTKLPYTLVDPKSWPIKGDAFDLFILKELEKNPRISLKNVAKKIGISQQLAEYHYQRHVWEKGLIEGFDVFSYHFDPASSDMFVFMLQFGNLEKLARFANSLSDKSFVNVLGKILGENSMIVVTYMPRSEFRNFVDALSTLIKHGLLKDYRYVIIDQRKAQRQTIPYEFFEDKDKKWIYDHEKHVKKLEDLGKRQGPEKSGS